MVATIFIDGQAGTTGLGIARRLAGLDGIRLNLIPDEHRRSAEARAAAMRAADLVILCLPDDAARASVQLAASLGADGPKLLDASTAHRTDPAWVYGFAELAPGQPGRIAAARQVANPGCYATAAIALLRPLVDGGLLAPDAAISINAVSGYSGGGNAMIAAHEAAGGPAFELYALGLAHKHLPEIVAHAGLARAPVFVPSVAHVRQGMVLSIPLHLDLLAAGTTVARLREVLAARYEGGGQVRVVDAAGSVAIGAANDDDQLLISVHGNDRQAVLVAQLDNLGKGASGAAVQNARLMLGLA